MTDPGVQMGTSLETRAWGAKAYTVVVALVVATLAAGFYLRFLSVQNVPVFEDDYASALQAQGITKTWKPSLPSGWVQWAEPVALPYVVALIWSMTGPEILVGRLLSAAFGTLSILVAWLLGNRLRNERLGIVLAILTATSLWSVSSSTYFRSYAAGELSFLTICYLVVRWLDRRRSLGSYLLLLALSGILSLVSHYLVALVLPAIALMPLTVGLWDAVGKRSRLLRSNGRGVVVRKVIVRENISAHLLVLVAVVSLSVVIWAFSRHGALAAKVIGHITQEFFTIFPEDPHITLQPFFIQSLYQNYGLWLLGFIVAGAAILLAQTGVCGLQIALCFLTPFVILSTIFASLTVTSMFDRYIFPFNPALLLMLSSSLVWIGEGLGRQLTLRVPRFAWLGAPVISLGTAVLLALAVVAFSPAFLLRFDPGKSSASVEAWMRARNEARTPSYGRAAMFMRARVRSGDIVLSTRTLDLPFEMPNVRGYWLMHDPKELLLAGLRSDGRVVNRYTGYPAISTLSQMIELGRGADVVWLMLPYFHDNPGAISQAIWNFVHSQMTLVPEASDGTIRVFRWQPVALGFVPLDGMPQPYGNAYQVLVPEPSVALFRGRPGTENWSGIRYRLPNDISIRNAGFGLWIRLVELKGNGGKAKLNVILEERDRDRWHVPDLLVVSVGDGWHEFFLSRMDFRFWPLGTNTREPDKITSIQIEMHNAQNLTFEAEVKILMTAKLPKHQAKLGWD